MRQRLAIARALLSDPELLVLDEPTNGLDPAGMREIRQLLQLLARQHGKTILLSSHLLGEVEKIYSRVGIIHRGRLIEEFDREKLAVLEKNRMPFEDYFLSLTEGADVL
jgi:ABC-type multidrug transport system ATPase subunit